MNKKEKQIITDTYKSIYYSNIMGINKSDSLNEFKYLLDKLGLINERYNIENQLISEKNNYNTIVKSIFDSIYETFKKYNVYVNYDLREIDNVYIELEYIMTEEENKYHKTRRRNILYYLNVN